MATYRYTWVQPPTTEERSKDIGEMLVRTSISSTSAGVCTQHIEATQYFLRVQTDTYRRHLFLHLHDWSENDTDQYQALVQGTPEYDAMMNSHPANPRLLTFDNEYLPDKIDEVLRQRCQDVSTTAKGIQQSIVVSLMTKDPSLTTDQVLDRCLDEMERERLIRIDHTCNGIATTIRGCRAA